MLDQTIEEMDDKLDKDLYGIIDAVTCGDYEPASRLASHIKSAGADYGLKTMIELGAALEDATKRGDAVAVTAVVLRLLDCLDRLSIVFQPSED
jgi:hypothetical protein